MAVGLGCNKPCFAGEFFGTEDGLAAPPAAAKSGRIERRLSTSFPGHRLRWLRGPAITEINSPNLRGEHRLFAEATSSSPRVLLLTSRPGNQVGIHVGMSWEHGNRTRYSRVRVRLVANLELKVRRPFEPVSHAISGSHERRAYYPRDRRPETRTPRWTPQIRP